MSLITVIGRGHSGTRAIAHTLYASGVYMGEFINYAGDMVPPNKMYAACQVIARNVQWQGDLSWDFSKLFDMDIPSEFTELLKYYLQFLLIDETGPRGWKIPETTLIYPWLTRIYPEIKYIFIIRNPRDCILKKHVTDDLAKFGVDYPETADKRLRRAISWKYQYDIVKATPRPDHWIEIRFEDFVLKQEKTLAQLEEFLQIPLARIIVNPASVDRWKTDRGTNYFDFFEPAMHEYSYSIPEKP